MSKENRNIEWLVNWAVQTQRVERAIKSAGLKIQTQSSESVFEQIARLGVRVDCSRKGESWGQVACHGDAIIIYDCIRRLPAEAAGLLMLHGRAGTRPDWCPEGVGHEAPVLTAKGKERRIYRDPVKCRGDLGPMMQWVGWRREHVDFHRAQYDVWYRALDALIPCTNGEMESFVATPHIAARAPWDWEGTILPAMAS